MTKAKLAALVPAAAAVTAAPIKSPVVNLAIPITTTGIYVNVATGAANTVPSFATGWDLNLWGTAALEIWANNGNSPNSGVMTTPGGSTTLIGALSAGTFVDASQNFLPTAPNTVTSGVGAVQFNGDNYIGFRFLNEADGQYHYGWFTLSLSAALNTAPRSIVEMWYEEIANKGIFAGDTVGIPEPSSAALLALGAAGIAALRRRNRK